MEVTGVDASPQANGLYHYDASLEECYGTKSGHPTYKHATEEIYLWYYQYYRRWYSTPTNCEGSPYLFRAVDTAAYSPHLVTAGSWYMSDSLHPALTVTVCRKIPAFYSTLVSSYSSLQKTAHNQ